MPPKAKIYIKEKFVQFCHAMGHGDYSLDTIVH